MENLIEVRGLVKKYKELIAVDKLDLDVKKGRILGLLGPMDQVNLLQLTVY